ncbi:MAG TPA: response regulator transcription factor, partial [Lacunisphaera sp.]|nr:response regulator transcription factor [Lacunisphaera sp.]
MSTLTTIRIILVDDSPIIRLGLRSALEDHADISIVGEAGTATAGLELLNRLKPDVVMLDVNLPDKSGLLACRDYLRSRPGTPVLILTSSSSERNMHDAIAAGAKGYLLKENDGPTLANAIRTVARGDSVLDASMAGQVLNLVRHGGSQSALE